MSSNSTKNANIHLKKLVVIDDDKFIEVKEKFGSVHHVSMVDQVVNYFNEAGFQSYDQMMEQELENQHKRIADFDLKFDFIEK